MLKEPTKFEISDIFSEEDQRLLVIINSALTNLSALRAVEINPTEHLLRSKIAWKLATHQHALLHRAVALVDGTALALNNRCVLSAMLSARAFMETFAVIDSLPKTVRRLLDHADLDGLDCLAKTGVFASRDDEWLAMYPDCKAKNAMSFVNKFDKELSGFRALYDGLSERCHPNSLGHHFLFGSLDVRNGTITYSSDKDLAKNAHLVVLAISPLRLLESITSKIDDLIMKTSILQASANPTADEAT